jgi:hypothetical protein
MSLRRVRAEGVADGSGAEPLDLETPAPVPAPPPPPTPPEIRAVPRQLPGCNLFGHG